eukprot:9478591-Pyramimonas_sp.AAC.1
MPAVPSPAAGTKQPKQKTWRRQLELPVSPLSVNPFSGNPFSVSPFSVNRPSNACMLPPSRPPPGPQ